MRTEKEELTHLALRQARRREIPLNILKGIVVWAFFMTFLGLLQNCNCSPDTSRPNKEQVQKQSDALWDGDAKAHRKTF
jgi:hypothetical protein